MTDFFVKVKLDPSGVQVGVKVVEKQLGRIEKRANGIRSALGQLFVGFSLARGIREAVQTADAYLLMENRLKAVSAAGTDVADIQDQLTAVSNRSRSTFQATADLYARLVVSSKELGRTQGELIQFTERLNKAIILSGASTKEAQNATIQLSQGLASGALRGDELRSVLEQLPAVADVIARGLGVTRGELRKLGEQGKITGTAILDAFEKLGPEIEERFGRTVPTLGQAFTVLGNDIGTFLDEVSDATNGIANLANAVLGFSGAVRVATGALSNFQDSVRKVEEEGGLASVGAAIQSVRKEIAQLEGREVIGEAGLARVAELKERLKELQAQAKVSTTLISPEDQQAAIKARADLAASVAAEKKVLQEIRGPQETYAIKLRALNTLLEDGKISQSEYAAALAKTESALQKSFGADTNKALTGQINKLAQANDLMQARLAFGEVFADRLAIEQGLNEKGIELNDKQREQLESLLTVNQNLSDLEARRTEEAAKKAQIEEQEAQRKDRLIQQLDVVGQLTSEEERLNQILLERPELVGQITERIEDMRLRALNASTSFADGFTRAFLKIKREAEDLASVAEGVVNSFANRATDALVEFAETGKLNFKDLTRSILSDITKIIARLLVVQAINAIGGSFGIGGGGAGANLAGTRAEGGPVTANRSFLVGEKGPEIFTPSSSGNITPNNEIGQKAPTVQVINVDDPRKIPEAISDGEADDAIINMLTRKKSAVQRILQR